MKSCRNCQFYLKNTGACVRYPPVIVTSGQVAQFPMTHADYFCGEFKDLQHPNRIDRDYNAPGAALIDELTRMSYPTGTKTS